VNVARLEHKDIPTLNVANITTQRVITASYKTTNVRTSLT